MTRTATTRPGPASAPASLKCFDLQPEMFASLAFDTMNILLEAVRRAGLNGGHIRDAVAGLESYKGVTGEMASTPTPRISSRCIWPRSATAPSAPHDEVQASLRILAPGLPLLGPCVRAWCRSLAPLRCALRSHRQHANAPHGQARCMEVLGVQLSACPHRQALFCLNRLLASPDRVHRTAPSPGTCAPRTAPR